MRIFVNVHETKSRKCTSDKKSLPVALSQRVSSFKKSAGIEGFWNHLVCTSYIMKMEQIRTTARGRLAREGVVRKKAARTHTLTLSVGGPGYETRHGIAN